MEDQNLQEMQLHLEQNDQNRPYLPARQDCHLGKTCVYELYMYM